MTWHGGAIAALIVLGSPYFVRSEDPSVADIVSNLREAEAVAASLNFCVDVQQQSRYRSEGQTDGFLPNRTADVWWEMRADGSRRCEAVARMTSVGADGERQEYTQYELAVFGKPRGLARSATWTMQESGPRQLTDRSGSSPMGWNNHPLDLIGLSQRVSVCDVLLKSDARVIDKTFLDGRAVYILQTDPRELNRWTSHQRIWLDAERPTMLRRQSYSKKSTEHAWHLDRQISYKKFEQFSNGVLWLPRHVHIWDYYQSDAGQHMKHGETHLAIGQWQTIAELPDERFDVDFESVETALDTR
jgi:hypothetical protein